MWIFRRGYLLLCFLLCCLCSVCFAQSDINFTSITVKEGLPSNTIYAILKDRHGLMWFATTNGLCRFDGTNFYVYRHEQGKPNSLPGNDVLSLCETKDGKIWIGSSAGGLSYYDRNTDRIISYQGNSSWPELGYISPRAITQDHNGKLWIATYGDLRTVDTKTGEINKLPIQTGDKKNDDSFVALSLFEDSKHRMWVGTNNGLYLYNWKQNTFTRFANNPANQSSLGGNVVKAITEDKHGDLWVATYGGLNKLLPGGLFKVYKHGSGISRKTLSSDALFAMSFDSDGKLWIGSEEGVNIFDPVTEKVEVWQSNPRNPYSLKSNSIRCVFIDPAGIYWVGTFGGGLAKYDRNLPLINLKQSDPFDPFGLKTPVVTSFAEYKEDSIFVGTDGAGVEIFNRKTGLFIPLKIKSRAHGPGTGLTILSLYLDHRGILWAGTYQQGLFRINPLTGSYEQFIADGNPVGLNNNCITSIAEDGDGKIWLATTGSGINIYDEKSHTFQYLNKKSASPSFKQLLPLNDFVTNIVKSPKGEMWIASEGSGVAVYNPVTKAIRHYTREQNHLPDNGVEQVFFDSKGKIWLSTGGGIGLLDEKLQTATSYTEKDGLASCIIKNILEDKTGLLWISTDRGISSFDQKTKKFRNFNADNGVQQGAFYANAGMLASNGDIYFGGRDGINFFNPATLHRNSRPGLVLLTDLKVSNESVIPGDNAPIKEQIGISKEISLKYGLNFSISYVALNYTAPKQNQFAYRLVGFEKEWNYVHGNKVANYTNIDPGTYVFEVKASTDGEHWSSPPTRIKVVVFPPFWRTAYAYCLYVALIALFLYFLRQRGIQKIRKEFEIQQEKLQVRQMVEQERREAEQLHQLDLLKIKFLTDLSHEFRTPISLILAPVEKLLQKKIDNDVLEDIKMISRNVRRLLNMANQLLDFRKMEEQELKLNLQTADIVAFATETGDSFKDVAAKKQVAFIIERKCDHWWCRFDPNKVERIIFNLLSNAFKFTPSGGEVIFAIDIVDASGSEPHLLMTVTDTGVGIPEEDLVKIFERFYQHQTNAVLNQGTGIGLSITKEFVELHGGHIYAENAKAGGTRLVVDMPMPSVDQTVPGLNNEILSSEYPIADDSIEESEMAFSDKKITVLLVEDNDEFRSYLADHLKNYYHIIEAANGKEGWQKTLSAHPQLVVSDINMPLFTGIELSKKIKEDKRTCHIPVILLTAMTGEDEQLKGLQSGASDYLSKPFNFQILNAKIANLLDLNRSLRNTYSKQIQLKGQEVVAESTNLKLLNSVMAYIEAKLSDPNLSVEELSKHVGMSRGSLYYKMIEVTGLTPIEYIRKIKLEKAAALLETSEMNVAQIAYLTGFGTPSYFSRMFKSKYGMVPSEYLNFKRTTGKSVSVSPH